MHATSRDMCSGGHVRGDSTDSCSVAVAEDFDKITLDESRAVLCIHMLCYVLDGSIGFSEVALVR